MLAPMLTVVPNGRWRRLLLLRTPTRIRQIKPPYKHSWCYYCASRLAIGQCAARRASTSITKKNSSHSYCCCACHLTMCSMSVHNQLLSGKQKRAATIIDTPGSLMFFLVIPFIYRCVGVRRYLVVYFLARFLVFWPACGVF